MKKVDVNRPGGYDRLVVEEHPDPEPASGEVLIQVQAIGVNYADVVVRMGLYESAKEYVGWPITPGFEIAGRVVVAGEGVERFEPGDEVIGVTRFGGYATRIALAEQQVFPIPPGFSVAEAAGFPAVFLTAYYAIFLLAHPREGDTVLVHSAAGGVGGALMQLSRIAGCRAVGVVGASHKVEPLRALGADDVIDKSSASLWKAAARVAPDGFAVVYDANGVATLRGSYGALAAGGKLVVYGFHSMLPRSGGRPSWPKLARDWLLTPRYNPLQLTNDNKSVLAFNLSYLFHRLDVLEEAMGRLVQWAAEGRVRPPRTTTYPLAEVARAHADIESGQTVGKLVLLNEV